MEHNKKTKKSQGGKGKKKTQVAGEVWTSIPLINKAGDIVSGDLNGSIGKWDQFSANDIKAMYDENVYTTKLELDKISSEEKAEARRLAAEIEGRLSKSVRKV